MRDGRTVELSGEGGLRTKSWWELTLRIVMEVSAHPPR
jgi:hypothetical protein